MDRVSEKLASWAFSKKKPDPLDPTPRTLSPQKSEHTRNVVASSNSVDGLSAGGVPFLHGGVKHPLETPYDRSPQPLDLAYEDPSGHRKKRGGD